VIAFLTPQQKHLNTPLPKRKSPAKAGLFLSSRRIAQ